MLKLDGKPIKIGIAIQVGITAENLIKELGNPIYQSDSTVTFLGKNKIIGHFKFKNKRLESLRYGRFNLSDKIFEMDSICQHKTIEEKLRQIK